MSSTVDPIKLRRMLSQIESIPTLPTVVSELFEKLRSPKTSAEDIDRTIIQDPALTSKILRVANSAFYGFPRKIGRVTQAVVVLGFETVRNLALTVSVFNTFSGEGKCGFDRAAFWQHSLACAIISRTVAERLRYKELEDVFIVGLLHDVGKIVLDQFFPDEFKEIVDLVKEKNILIMDAEKEILGISHPLIGAAVIEGWNLPSEIIQGVRYHHSPKSAQTFQESTAMVHIGDVLARTKRVGSGGDDLLPPLRTESLKILGMVPNDLLDVSKRVDQELQKMGSFLEIVQG